jgi:prepilin signal peptidase PulO-like enzyme (type II secretory pathway)
MAATELIVPAVLGSVVGLAAGEASRALSTGRARRSPDLLSWLLAGGGALAVVIHPAAREGILRLAAVIGVFGTLLLVLASDLRARAVYPAVVYPGIALAVGTAPILGSSIANAVMGAAVGAAIFGAFFLLARWRYGPGAFGSGDVYAAALLGAVVGLSRIVPALALVGVIGVVMAVSVGIRARSLQATFPYAPALCLSALVTVIMRSP